MSACYESLHIDTSKHRLAFEDYRCRTTGPTFPTTVKCWPTSTIALFDLRQHITFNTYVEDARRDASNQWHVWLSTGEKRVYDALVVANGHH